MQQKQNFSSYFKFANLVIIVGYINKHIANISSSLKTHLSQSLQDWRYEDLKNWQPTVKIEQADHIMRLKIHIMSLPMHGHKIKDGYRSYIKFY